MISFSLCGQRLVYLAERTVRLGALSLHVQTKVKEPGSVCSPLESWGTAVWGSDGDVPDGNR